MSKYVLSSYLALIYGSCLIIFETLVNWGQWQWWPFWLVDYVAAIILILGGLATLKYRVYGLRLLSAGWGFTFGMMWMSLASNLADGTDPERAARVAGLYVSLILLSITVSLVGLLLALTGTQKR